MPNSSTQNAPAREARSFARLLAPLFLLIVSLAAGAWWGMQSLMISHAVQESRTMADLADNVGRWASQYGGLHARTVGVDAKFPGNFLTRSAFASSESDGAVVQGAKVLGQGDEAGALKRVVTYYWKNPALIQREVADVVAASGSLTRYRLTARTVMNKSNAPNAFEIEALEAMQAAPEKTEYWTVQGREMLYARPLVAQKSCMQCHTSLDKAPEFIRTNATFNGGGGFGYVEGKPSALISVTVPLLSPTRALIRDASPYFWIALGAGALALIWLLVAIRLRKSS